MRPTEAALLCALLPTASTAVAQGTEEPDTVTLATTPCPDANVDAQMLLEHLQAELADYGVRVVAADPPARTAAADQSSSPAAGLGLHVVATPCESWSRTFEIRIVRVAEDDATTRTLDLTGVDEETLVRTLSLAIAELLRASWTDAEAPEPEAPPQEPAPPETEEATSADEVPPEPIEPEPTVDPAELERALAALREAQASVPRPRAPGTALSGAFVVRAFPGANSAPLGGRLSLDVATPLPELVVRIDAEAAQGTTLDRLGTIELLYVTGGATAALAASLGPRVLLLVGPRVAAGIARARGRPHDSSTAATSGTGALVLLGGIAELDVRLVGPLGIRFGIGAFGVAIGYRAFVSGDAVAGLSGGGVSGWLGIAVEL